MKDLTRRAMDQRQGEWRVVRTVSGHRFRIPRSLPTGQLEVELFDSQQPQSNLVGLNMDVAKLNAQVKREVARHDGDESSCVGQVQFELMEDGGVFAGPGVADGIEPVHCFQVIHLEGQRWHVAAGTFRYNRLQAAGAPTTSVQMDIPVEEAEVEIAAGWVYVPLYFQVDARGNAPGMMLNAGYDITAGGVAVGTALQTVRCITTRVDRPADGAPGLWSTTTPGVLHYPLAYVVAPCQAPPWGGLPAAVPWVVQFVSAPVIWLRSSNSGMWSSGFPLPSIPSQR